MKKRKLHNLEVSAIGLGCMDFSVVTKNLQGNSLVPVVPARSVKELPNGVS